jgi:hypothetical protein
MCCSIQNTALVHSAHLVLFYATSAQHNISTGNFVNNEIVMGANTL